MGSGDVGPGSDRPPPTEEAGSVASESQLPVVSAAEILAAAEADLAGGDRAAAIGRLKQGLGLATDTQPIRLRLADLCAEEAGALRQGRPVASIPADELATIANWLRQARDLDEDNPDRWRDYLAVQIERPDRTGDLVIEAQNWLARDPLNRYPGTLPGWTPIYQRLEVVLGERGYQLEQFEILQLLARQDDVTGAGRIRDRADLIRQDLKGRIKEQVQQIELALARGNVDEAELLIARARRLDPGARVFVELKERCPRVRQIQEKLVRVSELIRNRRLTEARKVCDEVDALDPGNPNAAAYRRDIDEAQRRPGHVAVVVHDPRKERRRQLFAKLQAAEREEDLGEIRRLLIDITRDGFDEPTHRQRLVEIDSELAAAAPMAVQRWDLVEKLLQQQKWDELRRTLNRNPKLRAVPGKLMRHLEISLLLDVQQGRKDDLAAEREEHLIVEANGNQPTFIVCLLRAERAMRRYQTDEAEKWINAASKLDPKNPLLDWPSRWLFLRRHGWKIVTLPLIILFWLLAKLMVFFLEWWEAFYFTRTAWICRHFPRVGLWSLESKFGTIKDPELRIRLFELLVATAAALQNSEKTVRYAEVLRTLDPNNAVAIEHLAPIYSASPALIEKHLELTIRYVEQHPTDRVVVERITRHACASRSMRPEVLPVLKRYLTLFPDDRATVLYLGELYQGVRPTDIGTDGLELLQKAWRLGPEETLWRTLAYGMMAAGSLERLSQLVVEGRDQGWPVDPLATLDRYEKVLEAEVRSLQSDLKRADRVEMPPLLERILAHHYLSEAQAERLLESVGAIELEEDARLRQLATRVRDHIRQQTTRSVDFRRWVIDFERQVARGAGESEDGAPAGARLDPLATEVHGDSGAAGLADHDDGPSPGGGDWRLAAETVGPEGGVEEPLAPGPGFSVPKEGWSETVPIPGDHSSNGPESAADGDAEGPSTEGTPSGLAGLAIFRELETMGEEAAPAGPETFSTQGSADGPVDPGGLEWIVAAPPGVPAAALASPAQAPPGAALAADAQADGPVSDPAANGVAEPPVSPAEWGVEPPSTLAATGSEVRPVAGLAADAGFDGVAGALPATDGAGSVVADETAGLPGAESPRSVAGDLQEGLRPTLIGSPARPDDSPFVPGSSGTPELPEVGAVEETELPSLPDIVSPTLEPPCVAPSAPPGEPELPVGLPDLLDESGPPPAPMVDGVADATRRVDARLSTKDVGEQLALPPLDAAAGPQPPAPSGSASVEAVASAFDLVAAASGDQIVPPVSAPWPDRDSLLASSASEGVATDRAPSTGAPSLAGVGGPRAEPPADEFRQARAGQGDPDSAADQALPGSLADLMGSFAPGPSDIPPADELTGASGAGPGADASMTSPPTVAAEVEVAAAPGTAPEAVPDLALAAASAAAVEPAAGARGSFGDAVAPDAAGLLAPDGSPESGPVADLFADLDDVQPPPARVIADIGPDGAVPPAGPVALRETGVSRRHPWRQRGTSDPLSVGNPLADLIASPPIAAPPLSADLFADLEGDPQIAGGGAAAVTAGPAERPLGLASPETHPATVSMSSIPPLAGPERAPAGGPPGESLAGPPSLTAGVAAESLPPVAGPDIGSVVHAPNGLPHWTDGPEHLAGTLEPPAGGEPVVEGGTLVTGQRLGAEVVGLPPDSGNTAPAPCMALGEGLRVNGERSSGGGEPGSDGATGSLDEPLTDDGIPVVTAAAPFLDATSAEIRGLCDNPGYAAVSTLMNRSTADSIPAWDDYLNRPPSSAAIATVLRQLGRWQSPVATPVLVRFLEHPDVRVVANAIEGLEANRDPAAIPRLLPLVRSADHRVRANAIKALLAFGGHDLLPALAAMCEDQRPEMRDSALFVLKSLKQPAAVDLIAGRLSDPAPRVRLNAIKALAANGTSAAREHLQRHAVAAPDVGDRNLCLRLLQSPASPVTPIVPGVAGGPIARP